MRKIHMRFYVMALLLLLITTACGPSAEAIAAAVEETRSAWTPVPTQTAYPTLTPLATLTPYPTLTAYPTLTPLPTLTPFPTYTPFPTFTPLPSPTPPPKKEVLFQENFDGNSSCFTADLPDDQTEVFVEDGSLHLDVTTASIERFAPVWITCEDQSFTDLELEVEATVHGGSDNNGYGVTFRGNDEVAYTFLISADGYYCLTLMDYVNSENEWPLLPCWAPLPEIRRGKQTNHLKVVNEEAAIELYINDSLVGYLRDANLFAGSVGVVAIAYDETGTEVSFDNLRITEP